MDWSRSDGPCTEADHLQAMRMRLLGEEGDRVSPVQGEEVMGASWSDLPPSPAPSSALTIVLASAVIVVAWLIVMVGMARGMMDESPYVPDVELNEETNR
jgi:hypothetical protein